MTPSLAVTNFHIYFVVQSVSGGRKGLSHVVPNVGAGYIFPMICTLALRGTSLQAGLTTLSGSSGVESMTALTRKQNTHQAKNFICEVILDVL